MERQDSPPRARKVQNGRCDSIDGEKRGFAGGVRDLKAP
jgi:hypothetical protein